MFAYEIVVKSGFVGYVLLILSIISLAIIIEKFITLRTFKVVSRTNVETVVSFLTSKKFDELITYCKKEKTLFNKSLLETLKILGKPKRQIFLETFEVIARKNLESLERGIPFLATTASISPLLGLLGTVLGMVKIFGVLHGAGAISSPQAMSAGLAEALLSTVFGLIVAVPTLVAYNFFQSKLESIETELSNAAVSVANLLEER